MFDVSPTPLELRPLNPERVSAARDAVYAMFMSIKRQQLERDPIALASTVLVWAEITKDLMERMDALEAA